MSADQLARTFAGGNVGTEPFQHWLFSPVFTDELALALSALPFSAPNIDNTLGRRETHNSLRTFFGAEQQSIYPACRSVAQLFQSQKVVESISRLSGAQLDGSSLRIEYCMDGDGFWLEPHTDIGAKRITLLVYLSRGEECEAWGTDLLNTKHVLVKRVPCRFNTGVLFVPGANTWHSFERRPINGVRRTIIVNYVGPEWRAKHELAYPEQPV